METLSAIFEAMGFGVFVLLLFILAIYLVSLTKTESLSESNTKYGVIEEFRQEAVDSGVARWVVNDKGEVTFEWIKNEGDTDE
jgi:SNF family Na+-dependent transporter